MNSEALRALGEAAANRVELWTRFAREAEARRVAEIGVYRGRFAARMLADCPAIETYYMVDPWRNLEDWNKPANTSDDEFERIFREAMERTSGARGQARRAPGHDDRGDRPASPTPRSTSRTSTATTRCAASRST